MSKLEFTDYLKNQIEVHRDKFTKKGIQLDYSFPNPFQVYIDENKFKRVIDNLLNNAFEALSKGQKVAVEINYDDENFEMRVIDNGEGIPSEILPDIFKPFVTHGKKGGTGLGLAITQKIIEDHNGNISVESQVDQGTRFSIKIPRHQNAQIDNHIQA